MNRWFAGIVLTAVVTLGAGALGAAGQPAPSPSPTETPTPMTSMQP
ncbi:MAG TPA: hypothetical protein VGF86_10475 [Candidatus Tumulicola sp.]|jgi:hypothetical protein